MGDDYELGVLLEFLEQHIEPLVVGLVECGVNLVEEAERRGLCLEDGEQQRYGGHCLFAAAEQRDAPGFLAGRFCDYFDAGVEDVGGFFEDDVGLAAAEELAEDLLEVAPDQLEGLGEFFPADFVEPVD